MVQKHNSLHMACRLILYPDRESKKELFLLIEVYEAFLEWLDYEVPLTHSNDLVALHRNFYEMARLRVSLPSQMITLGFRDWIGLRKGEAVSGIPLDAKLYSIKSVSTVSVPALNGRIIVPFVIAGYDAVLPNVSPARLVYVQDHFELWAETVLPSQLYSEELSMSSLPLEVFMSNESVVSRLGRLIAGMAHAAVDAAEGAQPVAVLEQALRDIDSAAEDVRVELGKATAEHHRLQGRRNELSSELIDLDSQVKAAIKENREDLASVGIDRQLDIEAQIRVLDSLIADVNERINSATDMLDAVKASRREAEQRLYEYKTTLQTKGTASRHGAPSLDALSQAAKRVEQAEQASSRITGVPAGGVKKDVQAIEALKALSREYAVKERLARIKASSETDE